MKGIVYIIGWKGLYTSLHERDCLHHWMKGIVYIINWKGLYTSMDQRDCLPHWIKGIITSLDKGIVYIIGWKGLYCIIGSIASGLKDYSAECTYFSSQLKTVNKHNIPL